MSNRFEGVTDAQWDLIVTYLPSPKRGPNGGMPPANFRNVINSIFYILIEGCRWCNLPKSGNFASRSSSHRWFQRWQRDGTWQKMQVGMLQLADISGKIDWTSCSVDGSFSPNKGRK